MSIDRLLVGRVYRRLKGEMPTQEGIFIKLPEQDILDSTQVYKQDDFKGYEEKVVELLKEHEQIEIYKGEPRGILDIKSGTAYIFEKMNPDSVNLLNNMIDNYLNNS